MLKKGANIEAQDVFGNTPLNLAFHHRHTEIILALINKGANIEARDEKGRTPLHEACLSGHTEIALDLINKGAKIEARDEFGNTPLRSACIVVHADIALALVKASANVFDLKEYNYNYPVNSALIVLLDRDTWTNEQKVNFLKTLLQTISPISVLRRPISRLQPISPLSVLRELISIDLEAFEAMRALVGLPNAEILYFHDNKWVTTIDEFVDVMKSIPFSDELHPLFPAVYAKKSHYIIPDYNPPKLAIDRRILKLIQDAAVFLRTKRILKMLLQLDPNDTNENNSNTPLLCFYRSLKQAEKNHQLVVTDAILRQSSEHSTVNGVLCQTVDLTKNTSRST